MLEKGSTKEHTEIADGHTKRYSASLVVKEIQIQPQPVPLRIYPMDEIKTDPLC